MTPDHCLFCDDCAADHLVDITKMLPRTGEAAAPRVERPLRVQDLEAGQRMLNAVLHARRLLDAGQTWDAVAQTTGVSRSSLFRAWSRVRHLPEPTAADLAPRIGNSGRRRDLEFAPAEAAAVRSLHGLSNRNSKSGSARAAIRKAIRDGLIRRELAEQLVARDAAGLPILTESLLNQVRVSEAAVRSFRHGRNAWLDYTYSPGSIKLIVDPITGQDRMVEPGEIWTMDDATMNFVACVPTSNPAWHFKVMPGRWQFLLVVDHRTNYIVGYTYTARPKGSYRAEDLVATLDICMREHGVPAYMILEKGISASNALTRTLDLLGVRIIRAESPHQKVVELVYNNLHTLLSFEPGQVGRTRGEEERITAIIESCRNNAKDPRKHFMMLADVINALDRAIDSWNTHHIHASQYGQWQPKEYWQRVAHQHLRKLDASSAWMFAPHVTDPLIVQKAVIETSVQMVARCGKVPGESMKFSFGDAPWIYDYIGARVRLHFNPFAADATAKAVLAEPWQGKAAGIILGDMAMTNRHTKLMRRNCYYSDDVDDVGAAKRQAQELYRVGKAVRPDGKPTVAVTESRDGMGSSISVGAHARVRVAEKPVDTSLVEFADLSQFLDEPAEDSDNNNDAAYSMEALLG